MATKALREAGPTKADKSEAMKRAGREWRAMKDDGDSEPSYRSNPLGGGVLKTVAVVAAVGALVYAANQMAAPAPPKVFVQAGSVV
jgi:hypothetical protein